MAKKLNRKSARRVFDAILKMPADDQAAVLEALNGALDELRSEDFFGTEGQLDPRGDGREDR